MAPLFDSAAAWMALRRALREDLVDGQPRSSWGRPQLLELLDRLECDHAIEEGSDRAVLRRFGGHLTDVFLNELPAETDDPLVDADPPDGAGDGRRLGPHDDRGGHDGRRDHAGAPGGGDGGPAGRVPATAGAGAAGGA